MKKARIDFIDLFRGIGIIFMIMGHVGFGKKFDYFIHAFHMPMFFFVSGYFYNKKELSFAEILVKKGKILLMPYLCFGILQYPVWLLLYDSEDKVRPLINLLWENTKELPIANALWFLTALFIVDILYFLMDQYLKSSKLLTLVVSIISLVGNIATLVLPCRLPWALDAAFVGIGLYHIAHIIKESKSKFCNKILNLNIFQTLGLAGVIVILIFKNGYINMRNGTYANIPLFWINAIVAILVGWNMCRIINRQCSEIPFLNECLKGIKYIGKNSITFLCLNQIVIIFVNRIFENIILSIMCKRMVILIITLLILGIIDYVIRNTKLKIVLGK